MSCELYDDVLDDYVDGARAADGGRDPHSRLASFEAHLTGCARCQSLVADFTTIRNTAGALEGHLPPPRLWARIESSVEDDHNSFSAWLPVAVAASLALLIGGAAWIGWREAPPPAAENASASQADAGITIAEAHYEQAIAGLQQMADAQNTQLDPDTLAVLRQNLAVIDRAIMESRAALANEPASAPAQESLLDALDTKVALLQDTVALAGDLDSQRTDDADATSQEVNQ